MECKNCKSTRIEHSYYGFEQPHEDFEGIRCADCLEKIKIINEVKKNDI